ncbi:hypothetical protein [Azonexus hydrophilus]|uniref:hypothetical protein n=1 Tax=Azonexus hydrophilus TaxID=418702 RepID=UPI0012F8B1B7|nr:hypothetical protein [Azonexus hydrophilus]
MNSRRKFLALSGVAISPSCFSFCDCVDLVKDFGADPNGLIDATLNIKEFLMFCVARGVEGYIPSGNYNVRTGVIELNCHFRESFLPEIRTGSKVNFNVHAIADDTSVFSITNGVADSHIAKTWKGGRFAKINYKIISAGNFTNISVFRLSGVVGCHFGIISCVGFTGGAVHVPRKLFLNSNPDPYNVAFCVFDGLDCNECGYAVFNDNFLGLVGCEFKFIRAINCNGGILGFGSSNSVMTASFGNINGWAFHDGTDVNMPTSPPLRFRVYNAELDSVKYGFYLNRIIFFSIEQIRFVHRLNNKEYWPRVALKLAAGERPNLNFGQFQAIHRIECGGVPDQLGQLVEIGDCAKVNSSQFIHKVQGCFSIDDFPKNNLCHNLFY